MENHQGFSSMQSLQSIPVWPGTYSGGATKKAAAPSQPEGYVDGAERRTACSITTEALQEKLDRLARAHHGSARSAVQIDRRGNVDLIAESSIGRQPQGTSVLPLRLGALRNALGHIREWEPWLLDRNPIVYTDLQGQAHIDYMSLAGFVVAPDGEVLSRSVNPD